MQTLVENFLQYLRHERGRPYQLRNGSCGDFDCEMFQFSMPIWPVGKVTP